MPPGGQARYPSSLVLYSFGSQTVEIMKYDNKNINKHANIIMNLSPLPSNDCGSYQSWWLCSRHYSTIRSAFAEESEFLYISHKNILVQENVWLQLLQRKSSRYVLNKRTALHVCFASVSQDSEGLSMLREPVTDTAVADRKQVSWRGTLLHDRMEM